MHRALFIPEVRGNILDHLVADTSTRDQSRISTTLGSNQGAGHRALAALARTCRTLSGSALDALWCELCTLEPLLQCSRAKGSDNSDEVEDDDESLPPFNEEEWNVMLRYAPRIRELTVTESDELSIKILQSLSFRTTLFLANLRRLHWDRDEYADFLLIRLLLGPSLHHLDVRLVRGEDDNQSSVLGFLECYHMFCPNIKSLHFHYHDSDRFQNRLSPPVTVISRAVCRVPTLEALTCPTLSEEAFLHVAKSRNIRKLSAHLLHRQPDKLRRLAGYGTLDCLPFENLRVLHLRVYDLSTIIPYLRSRHQPFEDISLEFFEDPSPEVFYEFFTALNSATRRQSLRRISLHSCHLTRRSRRPVMATKSALRVSPSTPWWQTQYNSCVDKSDTSPVHFEALAPLLGFSLRAFEVHLNNPIPLNDGELAHLVQGWPELETFRVATDGKSSHIPTLRGVLLLLARCQRLCHLELCVDARTIPSLTEDESRMCNTVIEQLEVSVDSPIEGSTVAGVVQFLLLHFPSLAGVACRGYHRIWDKVDVQIKVIRGLNKSSGASMHAVAPLDSLLYHSKQSYT